MQGVAGDNFSILLQNWKSAKLEINKTGVTFVKGIPRTLILETMEELQPVFYHLLRKGETFYSKEYRRTKKRNSYTIVVHSDDVISYGYIMYFVNINSPFAVVQRLVPVRVESCNICTICN